MHLSHQGLIGSEVGICSAQHGLGIVNHLLCPINASPVYLNRTIGSFHQGKCQSKMYRRSKAFL